MTVKSYITNKIAANGMVKNVVQNMFTRYGWPIGNTVYIQQQPFTGEKTPGELGIVKDYIPDFPALAARSWQAYTTSEIAQLIIHNYLLWTIGNGLKLKSEPNKKIIEQFGQKFDSKAFINYTESNFNLFVNSKWSTTKRNQTFHQLAYEAKRHAIIGGDCLVVFDFGRTSQKNKCVSARIIDGWYIMSPMTNDNPDNGNKVLNGVEIDEVGQIVAYWIMTEMAVVTRIPVYTPTGSVQAIMVKGLEYRDDYYRGMPLLSVVLEKIQKLDRYSEATVASAEERAKLPWFIKHDQYSTGEDPLKGKVKAMLGADNGNNLITNQLLEQTASKIAYQSAKKVYNLPVGADFQSIDNKNDLVYKDFYSINIDILCATIGIPPEVALSKYTTSFSSSRAANKNWEHKINFDREQLEIALYQPFYNYWLEIEILKSNIKLNGYLEAKAKDNFILIEAYQSGRFVGSKMPFIDPVKEVQAARLLLGDQTTPLSSFEAVTENLNEGDWDTVIEQTSEENKKAKLLGFNSIEPKTVEEKSSEKTNKSQKSDEQIEQSGDILAVKFGVGGTTSIVQILTDDNLTDEQKTNILEVLFSISKEDANKMLEGGLTPEQKAQLINTQQNGNTTIQTD